MTPFEWANEPSRIFMSRGYLLPGQSVEERVADMGMRAQEVLGIPGFATKFVDYMAAGFYSLASPVWANFGQERGLPISCNGSFIGDSISDILYKQAEIGMMTKHGAGTSAYLGAIRPRGSEIKTGGTADGPVHFASLLEQVTDVVSQGNVRRGNCAVYLDVEHPDIEEFLSCREEGSPIQKLSLGVCITDDWMQAMVDGDEEKRALWARILRKRFESGYPYIFWTDAANRGRPQVYKDLGLKIHASNLCTEIMLPSTGDESFVCDLSSMNLARWHDWKNTDAVQVLVAFLDAVMSEYIEKTENVRFMEDARRFAINHRAIGLGVLGWHTLLQSMMLPFESFEAQMLNVEIHKHIAEQARYASESLAYLLGEPPLLSGYGRRNTTLMAIAPTTSSSFILGQVSPSVEPLASNYFTKDLAKGKFTFRNPRLERILEKRAFNTEVVWRSILAKGGSVQHLTDILTDEERAVFKTFGEIPQMAIVQQASARQKYIDQGQSINLMIHPDMPLKDVNKLMIAAWEFGLKSLYYQRSTNPAQELVRNLLECSVCEA